MVVEIKMFICLFEWVRSKVVSSNICCNYNVTFKIYFIYGRSPPIYSFTKYTNKHALKWFVMKVTLSLNPQYQSHQHPHIAHDFISQVHPSERKHMEKQFGNNPRPHQ